MVPTFNTLSYTENTPVKLLQFLFYKDCVFSSPPPSEVMNPAYMLEHRFSQVDCVGLVHQQLHLLFGYVTLTFAKKSVADLTNPMGSDSQLFFVMVQISWSRHNQP